jgi:acyl carrier protein
MIDLVEPRVRGLVAEYLGVGLEELEPNVSLVDDLAADSLDLVEIALELESDFGIVVSEPAIERVRTYGDLVETVRALTRERLEADARAAAGTAPALVWACIHPAAGEPPTHLQRAGWLTPYSAETLGEDALRAGRGARLELSVPASASDAELAHLRDRFAWLLRRGVEVTVRRDHQLDPAGQRTRPHAAA